MRSPSTSAPTSGMTDGCSMRPDPLNTSTTSDFTGCLPFVAGFLAQYMLNLPPSSLIALMRLMRASSQSG